MCLFTRSVASAPARWFSEIPNMIRDPKSFQTLLADVRRFTRERCMPLEEQIDASDEMPPVLVTEMQQLGLFGHSIPAQYGGAGLTTEELALVNIEMSQCSPTFRARFGGNTGIAAESLIADGTEAQKQHYLPQLASGAVTGCFALTEPEAGSDAISLQSTAWREGDDWVVNEHNYGK